MLLLLKSGRSFLFISADGLTAEVRNPGRFEIYIILQWASPVPIDIINL